MKMETSMKICKNFKNVFCCGAEDLHYIFKEEQPTYYNAGTYGWNCDLYVDYATDTIITTGYRNTRGTRINYELIEKYTAKAEAICALYPYYCEEYITEMDKNKNNFIKELLHQK